MELIVSVESPISVNATSASKIVSVKSGSTEVKGFLCQICSCKGHTATNCLNDSMLIGFCPRIIGNLL